MALRSLQKVRGKDELALQAEEEGSTSETEAQAAPFNPFDLLSDDEGPGAHIEEQDSDEAPEAQAASQPTPAAAASKGAGKRAKKKGKKASKGTARAAAKDAQQAPAEEDDIDAQLRALGLAPGAGSVGPSDANGEEASASQAAVAAGPLLLSGWLLKHLPTSMLNSGSLAELLAVDLVKAKPQHEMRRIFGSRIVDAEARQSRGGGGVGQSRRVRRLMARGLIRREHLKRGALIEPRDHWPPFTGGLSMEPDGRATDGTERWKYVFSGAYQGYQSLFEQSQATMDPNNIAALLHEYPYHVDALLAMHELYRATGEHASSDEMLERCLYALDLAFHPRFVLGRSRVSHGPVRNQPLFAALFKQMQNLSRRGLHATALEYAKLLLSLDPQGDPRGVLCCIDYLALRAQRPEFLLELAASYRGPVDLQMLPSGAFSLPLARHRQQHGYSPQLDSRMGGGSGFEASPEVHTPQPGSLLEGLSVAVMMFPAAVVVLTDKLKDKGVGRDGEWGSLLGKPPLLGASAEDSATLSHLLSLFVQRHWLLWKAPDAQRLLKDACHVAALAPQEERDNWARAAQEQYPEGEGNEYGHLRVADFSDEASALPPEELQAAMGGAQGMPAEEDLGMLVAQMQEGLARHEAGGHQMTDEQMAATNPLMQLLRTMLPFVNEGQVPDYEGDDAQDQANHHQQQQPQEPPDQG